MLHRFIREAGGARAKRRGLAPDLAEMSRGACGPKPVHSGSAAASAGADGASAASSGRARTAGRNMRGLSSEARASRADGRAQQGAESG